MVNEATKTIPYQGKKKMTDNKITNNKTDSASGNTIPYKAFDSEYMTEWKKEVKYLEDHGIHYTYIRTKPEYGIRQYKYKKDARLFMELHNFYNEIEGEKLFNKLNKIIEDVEPLITKDDLDLLRAAEQTQMLN